ncbi:MAG: RNA polymerase sigma factor [Lachnospiraceae bacterium]|nr:RNA polymerase sigma factor [Lachnospiraceae bacterium]
MLEDAKIVDLYWARDEKAIEETAGKYAAYLKKIAYNILFSQEDSEETVNDTYLKAWNSMPENRPSVLSTYLGKITRRGAIDIYRKRHSQKREDSQYALSLEEMKECAGEEISTGNTVEEMVEETELARAISDFLRSRTPEKRNLFLSRYYYMDSLPEIAERAGMKEVTLRSILHREREALREYLKKEGYAV